MTLEGSEVETDVTDGWRMIDSHLVDEIFFQKLEGMSQISLRLRNFPKLKTNSLRERNLSCSTRTIHHAAFWHHDLINFKTRPRQSFTQKEKDTKRRRRKISSFIMFLVTFSRASNWDIMLLLITSAEMHKMYRHVEDECPERNLMPSEWCVYLFSFSLHVDDRWKVSTWAGGALRFHFRLQVARWAHSFTMFSFRLPTKRNFSSLSVVSVRKFARSVYLHRVSLSQFTSRWVCLCLCS